MLFLREIKEVSVIGLYNVCLNFTLLLIICIIFV